MFKEFRGKGVGGFGGGETLSFVDSFRSRKAPSKSDLLNSFKNIAYSCAMINAQAVASVNLKIYVVTKRGQNKPRFWETREVEESTAKWLKSNSGLTSKLAGATEIREIYDHPLQDLLNSVNQCMNRFDLFEYTSACQEIDGNAYWYPAREDGGEGKPVEIYPLEPHKVTVVHGLEEGRIIERYEYSSGTGRTSFDPSEIIHFKYCSLADPYTRGMSPLRAAFEQSTVSDKLIAYEEAVLDNRARPDMLISPREPIGQNEAARLERKIQQKFRGGGSGGVLVGESGLDYKALVFPPSDLAALQIRRVSKEEIANAFGVPISMLRTDDVNRANAEAGEYRHAKGAILPRCRKIEQAINHKLCPMYDERIFVAFDDPVPEDETAKRERIRNDITTGRKSINHSRAEDGLPPYPGCDLPFIPGNYMPIDKLREFVETLIDKNKNELKPND